MESRLGQVVIVGSQNDKWTDKGVVQAIAIIDSILSKYNPKTVNIASGECPLGGIDKWVERQAIWKGFTFIGFPPETKSWNDKWIPVDEFKKNNPHGSTTLRNWKCPICGMKARTGSTEIEPLRCSKDGHEMYIRARGFKHRNMEMAKHGTEFYSIDPKGIWSGGRWTIKQAKKLGKIVHQIEIDQ